MRHAASDLDDTTVDDLQEPVLELAAMNPEPDWPKEVKELVKWARKVKERYGFEVVTFALDDE